MPERALRELRLQSHDGLLLAADELPGEAPALLFLHGLASQRVGEKSASLCAWARANGRRLLRLDFRGHGQSQGRLAAMTLTDLVADARVALDHLGSAVVVGSSLGGLVGACLASAEPHRVRALVLLAPAFGFLQRMAARPRVAGQIAIDSAWVNVALDERVLADAAAWPESQIASRLHMPTLIVHGERDDVIPSRCSEDVFAAIPHPHKELWLVADGDHRLAGQIEMVWSRMARLLQSPTKLPNAS